jgi:hypothetical protein
MAEWISTNNRLAETMELIWLNSDPRKERKVRISDWVLVVRKEFYEANIACPIEIARLVNGYWKFASDDTSIPKDRVLWWMPLPELPKEMNDDG